MKNMERKNLTTPNILQSAKKKRANSNCNLIVDHAVQTQTLDFSVHHHIWYHIQIGPK